MESKQYYLRDIRDALNGKEPSLAGVSGNSDVKYLKEIADAIRQGGGMSDDNDKVKQLPTDSEDNKEYRVLLSKNDNDTTETDFSRKDGKLTYNPHTKKLKIYGTNEGDGVSINDHIVETKWGSFTGRMHTGVISTTLSNDEKQVAAGLQSMGETPNVYTSETLFDETTHQQTSYKMAALTPDDVQLYGEGNTWDGEHSSLKDALAGGGGNKTIFGVGRPMPNIGEVGDTYVQVAEVTSFRFFKFICYDAANTDYALEMSRIEFLKDDDTLYDWSSNGVNCSIDAQYSMDGSPFNMFDGDVNTQLLSSSVNPSNPHTISICLTKPINIAQFNRFRFYNSRYWNRAPVTFKLMASNDGIKWTELLSETNYQRVEENYTIGYTGTFNIDSHSETVISDKYIKGNGVWYKETSGVKEVFRAEFILGGVNPASYYKTVTIPLLKKYDNPIVGVLNAINMDEKGWVATVIPNTVIYDPSYDNYIQFTMYSGTTANHRWIIDFEISDTE